MYYVLVPHFLVDRLHQMLDSTAPRLEYDASGSEMS